MSEYEQIQEKINAAVASAIAEHGQGLVNKWICLIDNTDIETGQRSIWHCTSEDMSAWDSLGLLTWAIQLEQGQTWKRVEDDE